MKRILLTTLMTFMFGSIYSQTIVSTSPENKNAILEEFTGVNCQFCPQGHAIANGIKNANPDDFFIINVHAGGFAQPSAGQPDFTTPEGDAIDGQASVAGYPAGTVNRNVFPGLSQITGGTAMGRNSWANATNQTLAQPSYVNVAVEAEINTTSRLLTVHVEAYYTGNSPMPTNKLNVALLQNNTLGPQAPSDPGNTYMHMHRLVDMITTTWGFDIMNTTQGSFVDETFQYLIPNDYNGIPADINTADFEVVAFIAEERQNIISGHGAVATLTSGLQTNDATIVLVEENEILCFDATSPRVSLFNASLNPLTSLDLEYSANGESPQTYTWTGNLNSLEVEVIQLPELAFNAQDPNFVIVSITTSDDVNSNNSLFTNFEYSSEVYETTSLDLTIQLDQYPSETTWEITNSAGVVLHSGGPYSVANSTQTISNLSLVEDDCYVFRIFDAYGDGICCGFGNGSYTLTSSSGDVIASGGDFGSLELKAFSNYIPLSTSDFVSNDFEVFPNPTNGLINISANDKFEYYIIDLQGRTINKGMSNSISKELDLSSLSSGVYLLKVNIGKDSLTKKIILK